MTITCFTALNRVISSARMLRIGSDMPNCGNGRPGDGIGTVKSRIHILWMWPERTSTCKVGRAIGAMEHGRWLRIRLGRLMRAIRPPRPIRMSPCPMATGLIWVPTGELRGLHAATRMRRVCFRRCHSRMAESPCTRSVLLALPGAKPDQYGAVGIFTGCRAYMDCDGCRASH